MHGQWEPLYPEPTSILITNCQIYVLPFWLLNPKKYLLINKIVTDLSEKNCLLEIATA
jgi:hypothetical protein